MQIKFFNFFEWQTLKKKNEKGVISFLGFNQNRFASALSTARKSERNLNEIGDQSDNRVEII